MEATKELQVKSTLGKTHCLTPLFTHDGWGRGWGLVVMDVPPDAALISNTNTLCLDAELLQSAIWWGPGFAQVGTPGTWGARAEGPGFTLRGPGPSRGAWGQADKGKYFVLSRVQLSSHSALLLLPSQEQKLGFSRDDFSRCAPPPPPPPSSLFSLLLYSIVIFLNTTINIYKSCPEYFLLNHRGILGNSPITHHKLEA